MADMREMLRNIQRQSEAAFDSVKREEAARKACIDAAGTADAYETRDIQLSAVAAVQQWLTTDDLDEGENLADRLIALLIGICDADKDGEVSEDEQSVLDIAENAAWDYLAAHGATEADLSAIFNDGDGAAAERVRNLVADELPDGGDDEDLDSYVFTNADQEPLLDSVHNAVMDAVYKKVFAIRKGKKVRINKRISGTVRLTAKQKVAIRKARMKSHSAAARMRRIKSLRLHRRIL